MNPDVRAGWSSYVGLFVVTMATLMYELLLTRIFSVTMWYHFAFVAVSVAMFGMTVGALIVYLLPGSFTPPNVKLQMAIAALLFSLTAVTSLLTHLCVPFVTVKSIVGAFSIALTYALLCVPFVFSGICVCLALTRFPKQVNKLYAADLAGAAVGCLLLFAALNLTDGPTAAVVVAALAAGAAWLFLRDLEADQRARPRLQYVSLLLCVLLTAFTAGHTWLVQRQGSLMRPIWVKGQVESPPLWEKWNSFSRITVTGDPNMPNQPIGWGLSRTLPKDRKAQQVWLFIDGTAGTGLTRYDGRPETVDFLKYDVVNMAHYIRPSANVLVVGIGGGKDILSALAFDQKHVTGVEINRDIIRALTDVFGDFAGHIDRDPRVTFVNDEARSYITRSRDRFDIIQISLIDTWAATSAGAYILTENSLYTTEAWKTFLDHLTPTGVLTVSRWHAGNKPGEMYRLVSLARQALRQAGIDNPRDHMIVIRNPDNDVKPGVGTMLLSKAPFTQSDVSTVEAICRRMQFDITLTPTHSADPVFETLASGKDADAFIASFPINVAAPTDDNPFFFHMLRLRDFLRGLYTYQESTEFNMKAVYVLGVLLASMLVLTLLCIVVPLILTSGRQSLAGQTPLFVFFGAIGLGFILVEISQMQRLIVFLGHPTYGLTVVLFALLLSSGIGSLLSGRLIGDGSRWRSLVPLAALLAVILAFGILTPPLIRALAPATTPIRIAAAIGILLPLGLFMGMPFPLGMQLANRRSPGLTPWLWGINGMTSVLGSVLAVAIALAAGIAASFWMGMTCYAVAAAALVWAKKQVDGTRHRWYNVQHV